MSSVYLQLENIKCVAKHLAKAISKVLGVSEDSIADLMNSGKIRVQQTPDPKLGDYGFAIHIVLKDVEKSMWNDVGARIAEELYSLASEACSISSTSFVNGYINVWFDYTNLLKKISADFSSKALQERLCRIGSGIKVVVEHTSANPVHPLHIGSGRNSVIGDTYARLLAKLGFNVETRFYVNDLGRQVATLIYGVRILKSQNIDKPADVKPDHWYGAIYALTNIVLERSKLEVSIGNAISEVVNKARSLVHRLRQCHESITAINQLQLILENFIAKSTLNTNIIKHAKKLRETLKEALKDIQDALLSRELEDILNSISNLENLYSDYISYVKAEARLACRFPKVYLALRSSIKDYREAEREINELMARAERGDQEVLKLFREVVDEVLLGFKKTLMDINIVFNGFDYESDPSIVTLAHSIVEDLLKTGYARVVEGGAVEVDLNKAARNFEYVRKLFYPDQPGRFIVRRSDGTTLYVTRDIAYTVYKFKHLESNRVYNVIAVEQSREQKQLKAVLYVLGYRSEAENLIHFGYEMVHLKKMKMSGRRGIYYSLDELINDMELKMFKKLIEKEPEYTKASAEAREVARALAVGNVRALLLSVEPNKVLVFDMDKVETIDYASIIEYAFVRAQGIIRNILGVEPLDNVDQLYKYLGEVTSNLARYKTVEFTVEEKALIERVLGFERALIESYEEMKPNKILEYALDLALYFNKFYEKYPVTKEPDEAKRLARIAITTLILLVLYELLDILGIPKLKRM